MGGSENVPVITSREDLDAHVGQMVTIRGVVTNTKIPTMLGVDVCSDAPDLRGVPAVATGVLDKWTITEQEVNEKLASSGMFPTRGPGTYYRLIGPDGETEAQVQEA